MEKVVKKSVKSRIVTAAWQLFYEKGYNGTTVDDIIELSGTSKGSFYYYFSTKDELLNTRFYNCCRSVCICALLWRDSFRYRLMCQSSVRACHHNITKVYVTCCRKHVDSVHSAKHIRSSCHLQTGGTLLNQKFTPSVVAGEEGLDQMANLVRTYFNMDGHHIQFNVIDKETLIQAQKHPEDYKDLIVRVAGYRDHFRNLSKALQDEIIERTEQSFN